MRMWIYVQSEHHILISKMYLLVDKVVYDHVFVIDCCDL